MKKMITFSQLAVTASLFMASLSAQQSSYSQQASYQQNSQSIDWQTDFEAAMQKAKAANKKLVILFTGTNWCPACMQLEKDVLVNKQFINEIQNKYVFLKIEFPTFQVDKVENSSYKELLDKYDVKMFPTMLVVDQQGSVVKEVPYKGGDVGAYINMLKN